MNGCQEYMGITILLNLIHVEHLCYDGDAIEILELLWLKLNLKEDAKQTFVAVIESGTIDALDYLKQDYLIVDSIGLTYDIYTKKLNQLNL